MNFKVRDTTWFVGVGCSVLLFMVGLFSGFTLSGIPIFFVNMLLFMVASVTVITGAGLLLAATEIHTKLHNFQENTLLQAHSDLYSVAVGEDRVSLTTDEVIDSLEEQDAPKYNLPQYAMEAKEISYSPVVSEIPTQQISQVKKDTIFNLETAPITFPDEIINPLPLTKTELLEKIDQVQRIMHENKEPKTQSRIVTLEYPKKKPTIHEVVPVAEKDSFPEAPAVNVPELNPVVHTVSKPDLQKIILVGEKGINPSSVEFKELLETAYRVEDENFVLRLKGKTFGLGARGVKVQRKNTEFTVFNKTDISKMLKKF